MPTAEAVDHKVVSHKEWVKARTELLAREKQFTHAREARGAAAVALPSIALALAPKCPMCIAAWLAVGGGLGVSLSTAAHLRTALLWLCWSVLVLLFVRVAMRFTISSTLRSKSSRCPGCARGDHSTPVVLSAMPAMRRLRARSASWSANSHIPLRSVAAGYIKQTHRDSTDLKSLFHAAVRLIDQLHPVVSRLPTVCALGCRQVSQLPANLISE